MRYEASVNKYKRFGYEASVKDLAELFESIMGSKRMLRVKAVSQFKLFC